MRYACTLEIDEDIFNCLLPEVSERDRSSLKLERKDGTVKVIMAAQDPVALRATVSSLLKLLIVHEKIRKVKDGN
ncbi:hypothetical protein HY638_05100 [Candidatus Woesearchaeota archaeon]|nr:hypothetical protein [Candidatus Woesearchaeota archaeon]